MGKNSLIVLSATFFFFYLLPLLSTSYAQYYSPKGNFGFASCTSFIGWTCDQSDYNQPLTVDVYKDAPAESGGTYVTSVVANQYNANSGAFCGGTTNHGFTIPVPDSLKDGIAHNIYIHPHDYPSGARATAMNGSPRSITCSLEINGGYFSDLNLNQVHDTGEPWVGGGAISISPSGSISYPSANQYQAHTLPAGTYNVYLSTIPSGYVAYYPNNGNPPFYLVTVGNSCSTDTAHNSYCTAAGNIFSLNFALRQIFTISGLVYIDYNRNAVYDPAGGDTGYGPGLTIYLNGGSPLVTSSGGTYQYTNLFAGNYTVELPNPSMPSGYSRTTPSQVNLTLGPNGTARFGIAPQYTITGTLFIDHDDSDTYNASDGVYTAGATISLTGVEYYTSNGVNTSTPTNGSGVYTFSPIYQGQYQVSIPNLLPRYQPTTQSTFNIDINSLPPNTRTQNIGLIPLYQITGEIFNDKNKNGLREGGENLMSSNSFDVQITGPYGTNTTSTISNGQYTFSQLREGTYTISLLTDTPGNYRMSNPTNGPPPQYIVTVGRSCDVTGSLGASCTAVATFPFAASDVTNLNFAMYDNIQWFQCIGNGCRIDGPIQIDGTTTSGYTNIVPDNPGASCGSGTLYATIGGANSDAGVLYSGGNIDFGDRGDSAASSGSDWIVENDSYSATQDRTSYDYLTNTLRQSGITPTNLSSVCTLNNCTLPPTLSSGVYQANGNVTLNAYTFTGNRNYVILVNGNLTINGEIHIAVGSTAVFSTSGDIIISSSVGTNSVCSQTAHLEGIFSADGSFIIQGTNDCTSGADRRLNIGGNVIVDADGIGGGQIENYRDLCDDNKNAPVFAIIFRPDLMMYVPDFIKYRADTWKEVAP